MELQRSGNTTRIMLAAALAAAVVAYDASLVVYLVIAGHFPAFWSSDTLMIAVSALFLALVTFGACFNVRTMIVRRRQARALAARDPSIVAEASPQPDPSLALAPGETLTLTRCYSLNAVFRGLAVILYLPSVVFLVESLILLALPAFGRSSFNPLYSSGLDKAPAPQPTTLDWLAAGLPLLFVAGALIYSIWHTLRDQMSEISADDMGMTVRNGLGRHRIAWDEIELCARLLEAPRIAPLGDYAVWGRSRSLSLTFPGVAQETDHEPGSSAWEVRYVFAGGYDRYIRDAQRLLATIATRARTPLLVMRLAPSREAQDNLAQTMLSMTEERALALPLAGPLNTPPGATAAASLAEGEQVSLRARDVPLPVTGDWFGDVFLSLFVVFGLVWFWGRLSDYWPIILVLTAIAILSLALYTILFIRQRRNGEHPDVGADEAGIMTWGRYKDQPIQIPWQTVTAWVMAPPKRGTTQPYRYLVLGDGLRIGWAEPTHGQYAWQSVTNPRGSYRKQAERLHALIAARTGLPPREVRTDGTGAAPRQTM